MPKQKAQPPEMTNRKNLLHREPSVINNEMIKSSLEQMLPTGDEGKYARAEGVNAREVKHLLLEFQNVSQIANLSHMTSLTKLQMTNNILTKIEKLDSLVNLVSLDLSFNSIRKIENLENLRKLECINLHRNLITNIENMENQLRLEIFIISSNGIRAFEPIQYLRRFVRLQSVNFDGNPITLDANYREYTIALLPQITLLDYVRISPGERKKAESRYKDRLAKIAAADEKIRRRASVVEADEAVRDTYALAFVDGFHEDEFWDDLYAQDPDGKTALMVGDTDDLQSMYHELFRRATRELFDKGMQNFTLRQNETQAFNTAIKEEKDVVTLHGRKITEQFVKTSKDSLRAMRVWINLVDDMEREMGSTQVDKYPEPKKKKFLEYQKNLNECVLDYIHQLHDIWYAIMTTEMGLHEQIMEVNQELDRSLRELITGWLEQLRGYFGVLRDIQLQFNDRMVEDLVTYGNFRLSDTQLPEEMHYLLQDKEALSALIQASHENHNGFIDAKEEHMVSSLRKWIENAVVGLSRDEVHRNRMRVSEISHFVDFHKKVLEDKHILSYVTCYVPEIRSNQKMVVEEEEEDYKDPLAFRLSAMRISDTLLNLANLGQPGMSIDAGSDVPKASIASASDGPKMSTVTEENTTIAEGDGDGDEDD